MPVAGEVFVFGTGVQVHKANRGTCLGGLSVGGTCLGDDEVEMKAGSGQQERFVHPFVLWRGLWPVFRYAS